MKSKTKKSPERLIHWLPAVGLFALILFFMVRRKGVLLTYLQMSGFLMFTVSILLTYIAYRGFERIYLILRMRYYPPARLDVRTPLIIFDVLAFLRIPALFIGFFLSYYAILNSERALLLTHSGFAEHVIYPCSQMPFQTDEMKQEALSFWRMRPSDEFDCHFESSESKW